MLVKLYFVAVLHCVHAGGWAWMDNNFDSGLTVDRLTSQL